MSERDELAKAAMMGIMANPNPEIDGGYQGMAQYAYDMADAMLKVKTSFKTDPRQKERSDTLQGKRKPR